VSLEDRFLSKELHLVDTCPAGARFAFEGSNPTSKLQVVAKNRCKHGCIRKCLVAQAAYREAVGDLGQHSSECGKVRKRRRKRVCVCCGPEALGAFGM